MKEFVDVVKDVGFPIAVVAWMFWRDHVVLRAVENKLQQVIDLLGLLAAQKE